MEESSILIQSQRCSSKWSSEKLALPTTNTTSASETLNKFPSITDKGTQLSPISRTGLTSHRMCRHKGKWTKKSDKDIYKKLKIERVAMSILEMGLRIFF